MQKSYKKFPPWQALVASISSIKKQKAFKHQSIPKYFIYENNLEASKEYLHPI
jgi:hypothetical protein